LDDMKRSYFCEHEKRKYDCKECGGGAFCHHDKQRRHCVVCSPSNVFERYRENAQKTKREFKLTFEEFQWIVKGPCALCGNEDRASMGVDRVKNEQGYISSNVQPLCSECNFIKGTLTEEQLEFRLRRIAEHQAKVDALWNSVVEALRDEVPTPTCSAS
jgi:hypothetical protein